MATLSGAKNRRKKVRSFLEFSFQACAQNCIEVDVKSLKKFLAANDRGAYGILKGAIDFKKFVADDADDANWKCWSCIHCDRKFKEPRSHAEHVMREHLGSEDVDDFLKDFIDSIPQEWSEKLADTCWTPIDTESRDASGDAERKKLLESVGELFRTLTRCGILHISHLNAMLDYAVGALQSNGVDRNSTLCIRCLDIAQLDHVRGFLSKLLDKYKSEPKVEEEEESASGDDNADNSMRVVLDHKRSTIVIYADRWFRPRNNANGVVSYNVDTAAAVSWLYDETFTIESWILARCVRKARCTGLYGKLGLILKKIRVLRDISEHWTRYKDALQKMEVIWSFEGGEAETTVHPFAEILQEWRVHLSEEDAESFTSAITRILTEVEAINESGYGDDDVMMKAFANEKEKIKMEFYLNAAEVQKRVADISRIHGVLATVAGFDYLAVVIPIVKKFLRDKWESESKPPKGDKKSR